MTVQKILFLVLGCLAVIFLIALIILSVRMYKIKKNSASGAEQSEEIKTVDGVRYTKSSAIAEDGEMKISHLPKDILLARGQTYRAVKKDREKDLQQNELPMGAYTVLSAEGNNDEFKLRTGGLVRNFSHGDTIVLAEGEEICAVSATVILR